MKKYLLGIGVIVFALSLSAFTNTKKVTSETETEYYWYEVENGVTTSTALNPGVNNKVDIDEAKNSLTTCDGASDVCLFGSLEDDVPLSTSPSDEGDNLIYRIP